MFGRRVPVIAFWKLNEEMGIPATIRRRLAVFFTHYWKQVKTWRVHLSFEWENSLRKRLWPLLHPRRYPVSSGKDVADLVHVEHTLLAKSLLRMQLQSHLTQIMVRFIFLMISFVLIII